MSARRMDRAAMAAQFGLGDAKEPETAKRGEEAPPSPASRRGGSAGEGGVGRLEGADARDLEFPRAGERKTRRVNLVVKESDYGRWRALADSRGVSLTVLMETVMNDYADRVGF